MRITTLIENSAPKNLVQEWGLSLLIEYRGKKILLDAGGSDRFVQNCAALGVDLAQVDAAVLSHAHFDHSGGLDAFCEHNDHAPVYLRASSQENCYSRHGFIKAYIGIQRGMLERRRERFVRVEGDYVVAPGVTLVPHKQPGMAERGRRAHMFVRENGKFHPDDFAHEQSLVFETSEGLVIMNSCSHGGVDAILDEASATFPGKKLCAMFGGFHLVHTPPREVRALAQKLAAMGAPELYTGHCTGERALEILTQELPGRVHKLETGAVFELEDGGEAL